MSVHYLYSKIRNVRYSKPRVNHSSSHLNDLFTHIFLCMGKLARAGGNLGARILALTMFLEKPTRLEYVLLPKTLQMVQSKVSCGGCI